MKLARIPLFAAATLLPLSFGLAGCDLSLAQQDAGQAGRFDETAATEPTKVVLSEVLTQDPLLTERRFVGQLKPRSEVALSFQVGGELTELPVTPGTLIPKGQPVAALDAVDFDLAMARAQAELQLARNNRDRQKKLIGSAASEASYDQAEAAYKVSQVAFASARRNRDHAKIVAPFDALIAERLVDAHTNVQAGVPVVRVQDVSELRVEIALPQDLVGLLKSPDAFDVRATVTNGDQLTVPLAYREHATISNVVGRTYTVEFAVDDPLAKGLLPGMTTTVSVRPHAPTDAPELSVPVGAVQPLSEDSFQVWVVEPDTRAVTPRAVALGVAFGERVPVLQGLRPGERIVTAGAHLLRDGMIVEAIQAR